jgi:serine/threonine protein kinase
MNKEIDFSTDIWSVGSLIIEMASNSYPWKNVSKFKSSKELIFYIANSKSSIFLKIDPPKIPSNLSKSCKDFLISCFQRNPKNRPSAKKLLEHEFFKGEYFLYLDKMKIQSTIHNENIPFKFSNNSNSVKDNLKSTYLLKNHALLKDDEFILNELRNSTERSVDRASKFEKNSHVFSIKEENEKIVNFLSDNPENNASFSVSVTVYSAWSIEEKKINIRESQIKQLKENILEEMNEALEYSPILKDMIVESGEEREKKNHFDFENVKGIM